MVQYALTPQLTPDWHSIGILVNSQLILDQCMSPWHLANNWLTIDQVSMKCQPIIDQDVDYCRYWSRCQSRVSINTQLYKHLVHMIPLGFVSHLENHGFCLGLTFYLFLFLFSSLLTILFLRSCRHHGATYIFQFFFFEILLLPFILHVSNWGQISLGVKEILYLQRLSWNRKTEIQKCEFKLLPYKSIHLQCTVVYHATYQINYFLEMHWYCAALDILMVFRVVYQLRNFLCSNHFWAVTEYKQHSINDIGFSTAVGANNGREVLKNKMITTDIWESFNLYTTYMYCVNWVFRVLIGH